MAGVRTASVGAGTRAPGTAAVARTGAVANTAAGDNSAAILVSVSNVQLKDGHKLIGPARILDTKTDSEVMIV